MYPTGNPMMRSCLLILFEEKKWEQRERESEVKKVKVGYIDEE